MLPLEPYDRNGLAGAPMHIDVNDSHFARFFLFLKRYFVMD